MTTRWDDYAFMDVCLKLARQGAALGEVPVGSIVTYEGHIVGRGYNLREWSQDPTAHAEIIALRAAAKNIGYWRLLNCDLYVTLEPCPMCAGALINSRIRRLIYGCSDLKGGAAGSLYTIPTDQRLNHRVTVTKGVRAEECARLLTHFFKSRRAQKKRFRNKSL